MTVLEGTLLVFVGLFSGFINTLAGGGSLLVMPLLIFMGLPSSEANGTLRVALLTQSALSIAGFKSKKINVLPFALWVALSAALGAIIGSLVATKIEDGVFNKILAVVIVLVTIHSIYKKASKKVHIIDKLQSDLMKKPKWATIVFFFFIGIYGGFIQAGVGFLIIALLTSLESLNMTLTNNIKVVVIFFYTIIALSVFVWNDKVNWQYGLTLSIGAAVGGWLGSRWSVGKSDRLIQIILLVMVVFLSIKLWLT